MKDDIFQELNALSDEPYFGYSDEILDNPAFIYIELKKKIELLFKYQLPEFFDSLGIC